MVDLDTCGLDTWYMWHTELVDLDTCDVSTSTLVPGDIIVLPPTGCLMSCDAVLISGNAVVDEGMLTGSVC